MNGSKPVGEASIDVVQEAREGRSIVSERIKRLNDIPFSGSSVLRCGRQRTHVGAEVLSPIGNVLVRRTFSHVPLNPSPDVVGKPLVEFGKIVRDNESIISDVMPINILERIASVLLFVERALLWSLGGQSSHAMLRCWRSV
jgi:hypothetical protein